MSRRNRERRFEQATADEKLFHREVETLSVEGGTLFRIRENATVLFGPGKTRLVSICGGVLLLGAGGAFGAIIASQKGPRELFWVPMAIFGTLGGLCLLIAYFGGPRHMYELRVGPGGAVRHSGKQAARAGEVRAVWIECTEWKDDDGDRCQSAFVYLEKADGRIVELPGDRFTRLANFGLARAIADRLAKALNVPLNDGPVPQRYSTPSRRSWWGNAIGATICFLVGTAHLFAGLLLTLGGRWPGVLFVVTGAGALGFGSWLSGWGWRGWGVWAGAVTLVALGLRAW